MKKETTEMEQVEDNELRAEYDFSGGVRGKHYSAMQAGYTVTIHKADGATVVKEVMPKEGVIILEPDLREYFADSESVNTVLRSLIQLIPDRATAITNKAFSGEGDFGRVG